MPIESTQNPPRSLSIILGEVGGEPAERCRCRSLPSATAAAAAAAEAARILSTEKFTSAKWFLDGGSAPGLRGDLGVEGVGMRG